MNIHFANKLIKLRKEKGFSQERVAEELGLSRQAVSRWERAEGSPDIENFTKLAKLYGVSLDTFFEDDEIQKEENTNIDTNNNYQNEKESTKDVKTQDIVIAQIPFPFVIPAYIVWSYLASTKDIIGLVNNHQIVCNDFHFLFLLLLCIYL